MSKKTLNETISLNTRQFATTKQTLRHLRAYDDLRKWLEEYHPLIYQEWNHQRATRAQKREEDVRKTLIQDKRIKLVLDLLDEKHLDLRAQEI
jgi:ssDNA-binding replication factor A large subunit